MNFFSFYFHKKKKMLNKQKIKEKKSEENNNKKLNKTQIVHVVCMCATLLIQKTVRRQNTNL